MKLTLVNILYGAGAICLVCLSTLGQVSTPTSTPEEAVKVATDEVKLNVMARDRFGKFVPTLTPDDLLIVEEETPQVITSMRRVPASVLFLLDTGGDLNFVKSVATTKLTAKVVIDNLSPEDNIAVIQYSDRVETVSDWTHNYDEVFANMDKWLLSGKRSRLSDGLNAAVGLFKSQPIENRHLVLISDGLESVADDSAIQNAIQNLLATNITVHVISYTQLEQQRAQKASQRVSLGRRDTKPRIPTYIFDDMVKSLPVAEEVRSFLKAQNESQNILIVSLDNERTKFIRAKREAWKTSERQLRELADDTGGVFEAPEETTILLEFAVEVARAIGSQYVVTYSPTKPISKLQEIEIRKVRVGTSCQGVEIRSRHRLFLQQTKRIK